jgi:hypothetical protein
MEVEIAGTKWKLCFIRPPWLRTNASSLGPGVLLKPIKTGTLSRPGAVSGG